MSAKTFSCNPVIAFIASQSPPCSSIGCTTCGGTGSFARRMKNEFPNVDDVLHAFIEIEEHEIRLIESYGFGIFWYLRSCELDRSKWVINKWTEKSETNSTFALFFLKWIIDQYSSQPTNTFPDWHFDLQKLIEYATPKLIESEKERYSLKECLTRNSSFNLKLPESLRAVYLQDEKNAELESRKLKQQKDIRSAYLDSLATLPILVRIQTILNDKEITWRDRRSEWAKCTENDLKTYGDKEVQQLIDDWEKVFGFVPPPVLFNRRHELRLEAMGNIREDYNNIPKENWLKLLLENTSMPIESYPVELANYATFDWFKTIDHVSGNRFISMLMGTKLRIWRRVYKRLCVG